MIRKAKKEDSKRIWEIRNHPAARKYSSNSDIIPYENHILWFKDKYFSGQDNYCFITEDDEGGTAGYCRLDFDKNGDKYIISIAIDPDYHGRGQGHELLKETIKKFKARKEILAEIQKENSSSIRLFKKNDFKIYKEDDKNYYLKR